MGDIMEHKSVPDLDSPARNKKATVSGGNMLAPMAQTFRNLWKKMDDKNADVPTNNNVQATSEHQETGPSDQGDSKGDNSRRKLMGGYIPFKTPAYVKKNINL